MATLAMMEALVKGSTVINVDEEIVSFKFIHGARCGIDTATLAACCGIGTDCDIVIANVCLLPCTGVFCNPFSIVATCVVKETNESGEEEFNEKKFSFDKEMLADLVSLRSPYRGVLLLTSFLLVLLVTSLCVIVTDHGIGIAVSVAGRAAAGEEEWRRAWFLSAHRQLGQGCQ